MVCTIVFNKKLYQKTVLQEKEGVQLQIILNYGKIQNPEKRQQCIIED